MALTIVTPDRKSVSANKAADILAVLNDLKAGNFYSIGRLTKFVFITDITPDVLGKAFNVPVISFSGELLSEMLLEPVLTDNGAAFLKDMNGEFIMQILTKDSQRSNDLWKAPRIGRSVSIVE